MEEGKISYIYTKSCFSGWREEKDHFALAFSVALRQNGNRCYIENLRCYKFVSKDKGKWY